MDGPGHGIDGDEDRDHVVAVAQGIATAVAPADGLTDVQADLLGAVTAALTGFDVDYRGLDPLGPEALAGLLGDHDLSYRQRIVHHMVLGELVLRPIPVEVAHRVATYAEALGIKDDFVRVARRYAQGAYGLAWMDLQRNGFVDHVRDTVAEPTVPVARGASRPDPFEPAVEDPELAAIWHGYADLPVGTLGHSVWDMYDSRGFELPGTPGGAPRYLAQHDYVHVLADFGTNLKGELEVFAFIGRADPDPKGFAWLATLIGLFETGYISSTGFFDGNASGHHVQAPGMHQRVADAISRGRSVCRCNGVDLFDIDYVALADRPVDEVRDLLQIPPKSATALASGSAGLFDLAGMSDLQQQVYAVRRGGPS